MKVNNREVIAGIQWYVYGDKELLRLVWEGKWGDRKLSCFVTMHRAEEKELSHWGDSGGQDNENFNNI